MVWDLNTSKLLFKVKNTDFITNIAAISRDSKYIVTDSKVK